LAIIRRIEISTQLFNKLWRKVLYYFLYNGWKKGKFSENTNTNYGHKVYSWSKKDVAKI